MNAQTKTIVLISGGLLISALVIGWLVSKFSNQIITFELAEGNERTAFWTRFYYMAAVSLLVERSVEVYLKITNLNGKSVVGENGTVQKITDASKAATAASLVLCVLISFVGLRILGALLQPTAAASAEHPWVISFFFGVDVIVSAGLMAGGAAIFHPLANALVGIFQGLDSMSRLRNAPGLQTQANLTETASTAAAGRSIDDLGLAEHALAGAKALKNAHPGVVFTSGRRSVAEQASAMAGNIVKNRKWIEQTYVATAQRTALQKWVDDHPEATTSAQIAAGLETIMSGWTDAQKRSISRHMIGLAFDVQPIAGSYGEEVKAAMRALPNLHRFLERESGLVIWHAQFDAA